LKSFDESFNGAVISSFYIIREKTGWKLSHPPMIANTLTANSLSTAGLISAIALLLILIYTAFSHTLSFLSYFTAERAEDAK